MESVFSVNGFSVDIDVVSTLARAVFQIRHYAVDPNISQSKKKRSQERSLQIINSASSLTGCLAFSKPKTRGAPGRIEDAFDRITECSKYPPELNHHPDA
jgi:hypothetical protein